MTWLLGLALAMDGTGDRQMRLAPDHHDRVVVAVDGEGNLELNARGDLFYVASSTATADELKAQVNQLSSAANVVMPSTGGNAETRMAQVLASPPEADLLTAVAVSRLVSDLSAIDDFYTSGVGATKTMAFSEGDVEKHCYQWPGSKGDVCFAKRPDSATAGDFKAKDFETMLKAVRANFEGKNPKCGMDRWEDNHYAVDLMQASFSKLGSYIKASSGDTKVYYQCGGGPQGYGVHYISDPTGWFIQFDASMTDDPCSSSEGFEANMPKPNCGGGTCTAEAQNIFI